MVFKRSWQALDLALELEQRRFRFEGSCGHGYLDMTQGRSLVF